MQCLATVQLGLPNKVIYELPIATESYGCGANTQLIYLLTVLRGRLNSTWETFCKQGNFNPTNP